MSETKVDVIIEAGSIAPFMGVLVPENNYRYYQKKVETVELLQKQNILLNDELISKQSYFISPTFYVASGFIGGLIFYYFLSESLKQQQDLRVFP